MIEILKTLNLDHSISEGLYLKIFKYLNINNGALDISAEVDFVKLNI